ncbi:O-antigen ligase family protein [Streptacidiphilus melanogenes]|uniref:O-antigen ligase family protein n=1 Tax=Streptacidiphilus melanogenes TaxID=411235 RepID=UPI0005A7AA46|nr:O-antigen ligase family protein [Streptacidiphilus melanogenes]
MRARLPGLSPGAVGGTVAARLLATAMSFAASVLSARGLGVHDRGVLAVMVSVPAVLSIVAVLGMDNANARFAGTSHTAFRWIVRGSLLFSLAAGSALPGLWLLLGRHWPALLLAVPFRLAVLSAALCPVTLLTTLIGTAEIGRGRVTTYNLTTLVPSACYLAGVAGLQAGGTLTVGNCFLCVLAGQLAGAVVLLFAATARVQPDGESVPLRLFGGFALKAYLPNLVHYGMLRLDVPVIQLLAGAGAVALYAVALPLAEGLALLPTAVALVLFPRVTSGAVDARAAGRIAGTMIVTTAVLALAAAVAVPVLIPALYGPPYAGASWVVWAMLPGMVLFAAGRSLQAYLAASDLLRPVIVATAAGAAAGIALLGMLTPRYGAVGAAAADSAGYLVFALLVLCGVHRSTKASWPLTSQAVPAVRRSAQRCAEHVRHAWSALHGQLVLPVALALPSAAAAGLLASTTGPAAAGVGLGLVVLVCLLVPDTGLYTLALAIPLSQSQLGASLVTPKRLLALMLVCVLSRAVSGRGIARPRPGGTLVTAATVGYLLAASAVTGGGDPGATHNWQYLLLVCAPLLLVPLLAAPGATLDRLLTVFCAGAAALAALEIVQAGAVFARNTDQSPDDVAVLAITQPGTANHNAVGALLVMAAAVLLARTRAARTGLTKLACWGGVLVLTVGIAYSLSRAAYLAGIVVLVIHAGRRPLRALPPVAVGAVCLAPLLPPAVAARFASVLGGSTLDADSAVRLDLWSSALRMFDTHPVFGVGYLNFAGQLPLYYRATGDYNAMFLQFPLLEFAHNTYLTVLSQTGLLGAAGIALLVAFGVRRARSALRAHDLAVQTAGEAALLALTGAGVCSAFGEVLLVPPLLACLLLIVRAAGRSEETCAPVAAVLPAGGPVRVPILAGR